MVVLQKHYEFVDRPASEVSKKWKVCQIMIYIIAAITGFIAYYVFGAIQQQFGDNCILFPNITFKTYNINDDDDDDDEPDINSTVVIDESKTRWGNEELCEFCTYVPLMSMILASILITFFIMCPRGGSRNITQSSGIMQPWQIVTPSIVFTGLFAFINLSAFIKTKNGVNAFCAEFGKELNTKSCVPEIQQFALKESVFNSNTKFSIDFLYILLIVCTVSWFTALGILVFRCCCAVADFKLVEVTISTVDKDEVNLEETEVLLEQNPSASPISHI